MWVYDLMGVERGKFGLERVHELLVADQIPWEPLAQCLWLRV